MRRYRSRNLPRSVVLFIKYSIFIFINLFLYRLIFFFYNFNNINQSNKQFFGQAFSIGMRFDLRLTALVFIPIFIALLIPYWEILKSKWGRRILLIIQGLVYLSMHIIFLADFAYYAKNSSRIDASIMTIFNNDNQIIKMIWGSYPVIWGFVLLSILSVMHYYFLAFIIKDFVLYIAKKNPIGSVLARVAIFFSLALMLFAKISILPLRWSEAYFTTNQYVSQFSLNPILNIIDTYPFWKRMSSIQPDLTPQVRTFLGKTPRKILNVVMIELNGLDSQLSAGSNKKLEQLMKESWSFPNCYVTSDNSVKNLFSVLTGNVDVSDYKSATRNPYLIKQHIILNTLIDHEKFYFTGGSASQGNIRGLWTHNIDGLKIFEEGSFESQRVSLSGISDKDLFYEAKKVMDNQTKPFFIFIQTSGLFDNDEASNKDNLDLALANFVSQLKSSTYYKDTMLIVYGGYREDELNQNRLENYRVPLLFHHANILPYRFVTTPVSIVDILPTAISYLGYPFKIKTLGVDLNKVSITDKNNFFVSGDANLFGLITDRFLVLHEMGQFKMTQYNSATPELELSTKYPDEFTRLKNLNLSYFQLSQFLLYNNSKL
jgi:hypothetical protein